MAAPPPRKSKYTYRQLHQLASYSVDTPLRVVALVDLDAFYAQCEMKRLGVPPEQPVAVQQWQNLIAVNYPAKASGVSRLISGVEAKKLCPDILLVHVATWKTGEPHWSYTDAPPNIANSKASLDPYRAESRKILDVFKTTCPNAHTEKASIDESYMDLSKDVYGQLLQQFEALRLPPPSGDTAELLPLPDIKVLDWAGSHLVANADEEDEKSEVQMEDLDWEDVAMAIGARIVRGVRDEVFRQLGYTCSAGIANCKMVAKLGSGFKKPNQQSVVRTSAIQPFLNRFKYTQIRYLGGKLGSKISDHFKTESLVELLNVSLAQFQSFLPDDTATWFYNIIRGVERSPVTPKSSIKSMLSAKSFRDPLPSSIADCSSWLNIFVCDIMSRLEEEGVMEGKRRPKTMGLYIRDKAGSRSRQTSMPGGGRIGKEALLKLAEGLLQQVAGDGAGSWPCVGLSIQISGFEDREEGNQGIGGFLVKGGGGPKEVLKRPEGPCIALPQEKKRRTEPGIGRYFSAGPVVGEVPMPIEDLPDQDTFHELEEDSAESEDIPVFPCTDCGADIRIGDEEEHADWHFAKALVAQDRLEREKEREKERASQPPPPQSRGRGGSAKARGKKDTKKLEKGQLKLAF